MQKYRQFCVKQPHNRKITNIFKYFALEHADYIILKQHHYSS